ncbi:replication initiation protein [Bacillus sp. V5-8f]|uniref:replication initiation protein n=1 Tax=Bacillus sp. V5-8f TaxID=2053044 RepID=UPI002155A68B|nr:replication initiation protein [Bacillus sp. V5-8f]
MNTIVVKETRTSQLVTKSNMLIEASYKLGVIEQKLILFLASNINPADADFKTYALSVKEFNSKLLGYKGTPKYTELRQITKELMQKVFEIRINKKVIQVAWLSYVAYNETEGTIDIRFDPFLRPYLLELKKEFTSYKLENIVKLKSSYAIRIYELLKQYEKLHERTFLLSDLRKMLGADDIYPAYGNFKQRVLVPAQKELKKKTDISFEIEEVKVRRRVDKVKFLIMSTNERNTESLEQEIVDQVKVPNSFLQNVKRFGLKLGVQINDEVIHSWERYGQDNVINLLERIEHRTDIDNPIGYITKVLSTSGSSEAHALSENDEILVGLIADFRKSKESLPEWFVQEKAIDEIQNRLGVDPDTAKHKFMEIKNELYGILNITEPVTENSVEENIEEWKKDIEARLNRLNQ